MKQDAAMFVFSVLSLVVCAAVEDLSPKFLDLGLPFVMAAAIVFSDRNLFSWTHTIVFAAAAGAIEDALCGFPPATSASFFAAAAFAVRKLSLSPLVSSLAFPLYLVWLWTWGLVSGGGNYLRFVFFAPFGLVATFVVSRLVWACAGKAGLR